MWPLNDEIPLIENISENEENIIKITHSKGQFKINKKEIVDVQMKSDFHSLKSNPYYSDEHAFMVLIEFYKTRFDNNFSFIGAFSLNMIRAIISLGIVGGISCVLIRSMDLLHFFNPYTKLVLLLILIILIWIVIDKSIRSVIFPVIIKLLFSDFIKKDIFLIKTTGNTFEFRGSNVSGIKSAKDILPYVKDSDESLSIINAKKKILYILFYSFIVINFIFNLIIFLSSSFVQRPDSLILFFYAGAFGIILLVSIPIIAFAIYKIGFLIIILLLLIPIISVTGGALLALLPAIIYRVYYSSDKWSIIERKSTSKWRGRLKIFFFFLLGILYYFVFENIVYLPIYIWSKTIHPFWYYIYFDFNLYLFIISIFSIFSLYPIAYILDNLIEKKD